MLLLGDLLWVHRLLAVLLGAVIGVVMTAVFAALAWLLGVHEVRALVRHGQRLLGRILRRGRTTTS